MLPNITKYSDKRIIPDEGRERERKRTWADMPRVRISVAELVVVVAEAP